MKDNDPFFKGYTPVRVKYGNIYKYIIGTASSADKAREHYTKIKKSFTGSFLVAVEGDNVKRIN